MKKLIMFMLSLSLALPTIAQTRQDTTRKKTEKSKPAKRNKPAKKDTPTRDTMRRDTATKTLPPQ